MNRRRAVSALGAALLPPAAHGVRADRLKPQAGDILVHAFGDGAGAPLRIAEIGDDRIFAFPKAEDGTVRNGSLHNQVCVVRVDPVAMAAGTRRYAAGPIIALSAACTHTGCEITGWRPDTNELVCPCHGSRFDVLDAARVVQGPAPKPLAFLPIEQHEGLIRVVGKFSRRVGPDPTF